MYLNISAVKTRSKAVVVPGKDSVVKWVLNPDFQENSNSDVCVGVMCEGGQRDMIHQLILDELRKANFRLDVVECTIKSP